MRSLLLFAALAVLLVAVAAQYAQPQDQFQVSAAYEELSQDLPLQVSGEDDSDSELSMESDSESESDFDISAIRRLRKCPRGFKTFDVPLSHRPFWHKHRHSHRFRWAGPNREFMCVPFNLVKGVDPVFLRLRGRRWIHRDPLTDPELRRIAQMDFSTAAEGDADADAESEEMIISEAEVDNVQTELQEIKQKEDQTLSPRMIRLRDLFKRGGLAMRKVKEGTAGFAELEELKSVRLGLSNEFRSYPQDLQEQIRPSYNKIDAALGIVIDRLQMKLKTKGIKQVEPVEEIEAESLDSSSDIADDLLSLLTSVAAADMGVDLPRDQTTQFETSGKRGGWGGWGWGGFGGYGGWGGKGFRGGFGHKGLGFGGFGHKGFGWGGFGGWGLPLGLGYAAPLALGYSGLGLGSWGYRGFGGFGYPFVGSLALGLGGFGGYGLGAPLAYGGLGGYGLGGYGLGYGLGGFGLGLGGFGWGRGFGRGFGWGGRRFGRW